MENAMRRLLPLAGLALPFLALPFLALPALAQPPAADPDWPCQQRLVHEVTAATFWATPMPESVKDWRNNMRVNNLVEAVGPRETDQAADTAKLEAFAKSLKPAERKELLPAVFAGLVELSNEERARVIDRIEELMRRQHGVADEVAKVSAEAAAIPEDAQGPDADKRAEALQRAQFLTRTFNETQRTVRYACEVPAQLDSRLGAFARTLEAHL